MQIVIGRGFVENKVEFKKRIDSERVELTTAELISRLNESK